MRSGQFIYGFHAVLSALKSDPFQVVKVLFNKTRVDRRMIECLEIAKQHGIKVTGIEKSRLDKMSGHNTQGIMATISPSTITQYKLTYSNLILALDGVTDTYNIGSCVRAAEAWGAGIVVTKKCNGQDALGVINKTSSGASNIVSVMETESISMMASYFRSCGFYILGADHSARSPVYNSNLCFPLVLVVGSEGKGLSSSVRSVCHKLVRIPMWGRIPCLNVSIATGVLLYEIKTRIVS